MKGQHKDFITVQLVHLRLFALRRRLGSEASQPFNEVLALSHKSKILRSDKVRSWPVKSDSNLLDLNSSKNNDLLQQGLGDGKASYPFANSGLH